MDARRNSSVPRGLTVLLSSLSLALLLGGCAKPVVTPTTGGKAPSYWVEALASPDAKVRKEAVFKLGNAGPLDDTIYPALLGALKDKDPKVRCEAILALLKFGPQAREAIPQLTELQQRDKDAQVRSYATKALSKLQSEATGNSAS